jgi:hypothetical protein
MTMGRFLVMMLDTPLELSCRAVDSPGELVQRDRMKERAFEGPGFLGFYDWLRNDADEILGVRLTLHEHALELHSVLPQRPYLEWEGRGIVRLTFRAGDVDEERSVDQEFSVSRCYVGLNGRVALLFDASELSEEDCLVLAHS